MQIQKSGKASDLFLDELTRLLPKTADVKDDKDTPKEELLEKDRNDKGHEAEADKITETQLPEAGERNDEPVQSTFEGQLEDNRKGKKAAAPNVDVEGITERRLNDASKDLYPHRNPKAHERTGNKRPVNALREEMGNASDEAKRERYEKAYKGQKSEKRILDEDIGSQKTEKKAFNLRGAKTAAIEACKEYIQYKQAQNKHKESFAAVGEIDSALTDIMEMAQTEKRTLTADEQAKVMALKIKKSEILNVFGKKKLCDHHAKWHDDEEVEITNDGGECETCVHNNEKKYDPPDPDYGGEKTAKLKRTKIAQPMPPPELSAEPIPTQGQGIKVRKIVSRYEIYEENDQSFAGDPVIEDDEELDFSPDEYDLEEGLSAAKLAAKYIVQNSGSIEPSSSQFHQGVWYSSTESDMHTGDQIETSFHVKNATPEQEQELYGLITQR
jgi:hypothetical protein